jgi:hypothetical protein
MRTSPSTSLRAKRSNPACRAKKAAGLLRRYAPRNDVVTFRFKSQTAHTRPRSRGTILPEVYVSLSLERKGGAGNAGCALHPRSRVQKPTSKNAHEHTGSAEAIRHSLRNGFTAYAVPRRRIRLVTVAAGLTADRPGWIDFATDGLAPATGVGTTRFCRTQERRSSARRCPLTDQGSALRSPCAPALPRPPHPIPRS